MKVKLHRDKMFRAILMSILLVEGVLTTAIQKRVAKKDILKQDDVDLCEDCVSLPLEEFGDSYYYFGFIFTGNYFQAIQFCNYHQMSLVSIETKEENDFLNEKLNTIRQTWDHNIWTSGTTLPDNSFVWLGTGKPIEYTNWQKAQPDNSKNNEKCVEVKISSAGKLEWNDNVCDTTQNYFICEKDTNSCCYVDAKNKLV